MPKQPWSGAPCVVDGSQMRGAREEIGAADECRCPMGLGVCTSIAASPVSPARSYFFLFGFALGFFASQLWLQLGRATRQHPKPWSWLHRRSDWMRAVRWPGQKSRRGGDATGILCLCVSESASRREWMPMVLAAVMWRPCCGGSVSATSGMENQAPKQPSAVYRLGVRLARNCCFRASVGFRVCGASDNRHHAVLGAAESR